MTVAMHESSNEPPPAAGAWLAQGAAVRLEMTDVSEDDVSRLSPCARQAGVWSHGARVTNIAAVLVSVAHAANEPEAAMIRAQLSDAGIPSITKGPSTPQLGGAGACDVYVDEQLAASAREVLATPPFDDDELARLSEEAAREYGV
jgi:hypothetical protein